MKKTLLVAALSVCKLGAIAQSKNFKYGVTAGGHIQHYNGNLGNSFFKFNTTCFGGGSATVGVYMSKSFDVNVGGSVGFFGYCQTDADERRTASVSQRCPGCTRLGMGELRSVMIAGNVAVKYKFANDVFLKEDAKVSPYVYLGAGLNRLSDVMQRDCVNEGNHVTVNAGTGIKYNFCERFNVGYNLALGAFVAEKAYATNALDETPMVKNAEEMKMEKRRDMYMQNSLFLGVNF
ncbi:MAG TPA: outer membrane beta-barrel protein [Chitinophagales bacterium]|nr:outer membrane beta-barrel protein [Chitinophagales bacterium]